MSADEVLAHLNRHLDMLPVPYSERAALRELAIEVLITAREEEAARLVQQQRVPS